MMKKKNICFGMLLSSMIIVGCGEKEKETSTSMETVVDNPFFSEYDTPFGVPPFALISEEHYKPAFLEGMQQQMAEIDAILANEEEPTFENTILPLEYSGDLLKRVSSVFYNLNSAHTNDNIQGLANEIAPLYSAHSDNINLNQKLFERVKFVWENRENADLNNEQLRLLEKKYVAFVRSGANLNETEKQRLREINERTSLLTLQFGQNVLAETNDFKLLITAEEDLEGLPISLRTAAQEEAVAAGHENTWLFTLNNPSVMPFLQYAANRELRKQIWNAYQLRGNNGDEKDNSFIVRELVNLRKEKALLLGYDNHAAFKLEQSMAGSPEEVMTFLNQLWKPALAKAKNERDEIAKMMKQDEVNEAPQPYDWRYYAERIRKAKFDLDEDEVKPYFSLDNVQKGIFDLCDRLFGLQFERRSEIIGYHEEMVAYEVKEKDGSHVGILFMDFHPRPSKRGGAWMTSYRSQSINKNGDFVAPVISIVCNFTKPTASQPALLTFDEVETFFHEFGHALHGLLSNVTYPSLAGTNVYTDFVELPSQIMENWAAEPEFLKTYAMHYETGEVIPDALIEKLIKSGTFGQGFATTEYLAASFLDMFYHTMDLKDEQSVEDFETEKMKEIGLIKEIIPRYRSTYFSHIFAGGYSAGYYSYIWSGVLDTDAFEAFKETSLFDQETALSFRTNILEAGSTYEPMDLYVKFRGRKPVIEPLLRKRGLK